MTGPFQIAGRVGLTRLLTYPIALTVVGAAFASPWRVGVVNGKSMVPTLQPGSVMIYDRHYDADHPIEAGDVVLFRQGGETWVKRVYGVAGKSFWAFHERLEGSERYSPIGADSRARFEALARGLRRHGQFARVVQVRVKPAHVFVTGDGSSSNDSGSMGQVPARQILGRVVELPWQNLRRDPLDSEWSLPPAGRTRLSRKSVNGKARVPRNG